MNYYKGGWRFWDRDRKDPRMEANKQFKEVQRQYLHRMVCPTLWTKIRFNFWRLYWKIFMPKNVYIHIGVHSNYCVYRMNPDDNISINIKKTRGSLEGKVGKDKRKYIKWFAKYNRSRNADISV